MCNKREIEIAKTLASEYRQQNEHKYYGGVVVIFNGEVAGWMNELRDPNHWIAGCVAVDIAGRAWQAAGGNEQDGATHWETVNA